MAYRATSVEQCYVIARTEAEHYQKEINRLSLHGEYIAPLETAILRAKRDAASNIARIIRFGWSSDNQPEGGRRD